MSGQDDYACAGGSRPRSSSTGSNASQLSDYDPAALSRRLSNVNPRDLYHIAVGDLEDSQERQDCERERAEAVMRSQIPRYTDPFKRDETGMPDEMRIWDFTGRPRVSSIKPHQGILIDYSVSGMHDVPPRQPGICDRMGTWISHTFCYGCQNPHVQLNESREMDTPVVRTFKWQGQATDCQPVVISEPGDWAPDAL